MHRTIERLARYLAYLGGVILMILIAVTFVSVFGRSANTIGHMPWVEASAPAIAAFLQKFGPLRGDFEIVEAGMAVAIIAFLPWCSIVRGHATVDIFTLSLPKTINRFIDLLWEILMTVVLGVLAWRLFVGMSDKMRYGETSFLLQFPIWWAFAVCAVMMTLAAIISAWMIVERWADLRNHPLAPPSQVRIDH